MVTSSYLDVSFNVFRCIQNLTHEGLPQLTDLYLIAAKISKIEGMNTLLDPNVCLHDRKILPQFAGLETLTTLTTLELGSNRVRVRYPLSSRDGTAN